MVELDCPYLIHIQSAFRDSDKVQMVLEFCAGGEMYTHIVKDKNFSERVRSSAPPAPVRSPRHSHTRFPLVCLLCVCVCVGGVLLCAQRAAKITKQLLLGLKVRAAAPLTGAVSRPPPLP